LFYGSLSGELALAAVKLLQDRGELLLAMEVRKLIEEAEKSDVMTARPAGPGRARLC
jgi:hypothetical protein